MTPENLLYAKSHEWVEIATDNSGAKIATVGLSKFALDALTDLVYIDLPGVGDSAEIGETFGEIESVKAVSEMYSPVSGEIVAVNDAVGDQLETLAQDPYQNGWLIKIKMASEDGVEQLLDFVAYQKHCETEGH